MRRIVFPTFAIILLQFIAARSDGRGLLVSPAQLGMVGKPASSVSGIISVSSSRHEQTQVRISLSDFIRNLDGKVREVPAQQAIRSCKAWLEVEQREFTSPESGTVPLIVSAKIPENAMGSYWALVNLEAVPPPPPFGRKRAVGFQLVPRIAVPVIITVSGTEHVSVHATGIDIGRAAQSGGLDADVVVENDGNTAVLLSGALALERPSGAQWEELTSIDIGPVTSLPGTKVKVKGQIPWKGDLNGLQAHAYLRYGPNPDQTLETTAHLDTVQAAARRQNE